MSHAPNHKRVVSDSAQKAGYHGAHQYSTFSASTIRRDKKYCCFLCRLSGSLVLHPVGPFRSIWDAFVMLLLVYTSIEIPYIMSFGQSNISLIIGLCVDTFLMLDILFNFHTAYFDKYDRLRLVTNQTSICKHYLRTWFLIDFITCIPFELIPDENSEYGFIKMLRVFRLFRIIKILRFVKMLRIFDSFMKQFVIREVLVFMRLFKIICGMLLSAHFAACLWWYVGQKTSPSWVDAKGLRSDDIDNFTKFTTSFYWAVVTLFTTGYGDIHATNVTEQWICSICILIGTCFYAYFIGTLTVLITEGDKIKSYQSDKLEEAQSFCEKKKLPKELSRAILTHIRYHCTYNYVFDENEILGMLPAYLQHDIHAHVAKQFLLRLKVFQNEYIHLPEFIIGLIAVKSKSISCNQWFKLYDVGDIAKEFYIQRTGVSTMYDENNQMMYQLSRGNVCGEYSSILFKKRKLKVECSTWSEFYSISVDDIKQILDLYYPKSSASKWNQIKNYLRVAYKNHVRHSVKINNYNEVVQTNGLISSVALHSPKRWDIHLFNNEGTHNFVPVSSSRVQTPLPPESDNEDIQDDIFTSSRNPSLRHEHSLPRNKYKYHSYAVTNMNPNNDVNSSAKITKAKRSSASNLQKLVRYQIRSNSEIRDSVVVAHAAKHQKRNSLGERNSLGVLKYGSNEKQAVTTTEMTTLKINTTLSHLSENIQNNDIYDSECSFSASYSSHSSSDDVKHRRIGAQTHKNVKRTTKKRRRGIRGSSFGKGYVHGGGAKKYQPVHFPRNATVHRKSNVDSISPITEISVDESELLAALNSPSKGRNNNKVNKQIENDECIKEKIQIVNVNVNDNIGNGISGKENMDGGVTGVTLFMPSIQSQQNLYTNADEHGSTITKEEDKIETVS